MIMKNYIYQLHFLFTKLGQINQYISRITNSELINLWTNMALIAGQIPTSAGPLR